MLSDDKRDSLKSQMQILNEQFHATIAAGGTFEDVKSLYLQMKSLYQKASAAGLDIVPEASAQQKKAQSTNLGTRL